MHPRKCRIASVYAASRPSPSKNAVENVGRGRTEAGGASYAFNTYLLGSAILGKSTSKPAPFSSMGLQGSVCRTAVWVTLRHNSLCVCVGKHILWCLHHQVTQKSSLSSLLPWPVPYFPISALLVLRGPLACYRFPGLGQLSPSNQSVSRHRPHALFLGLFITLANLFGLLSLSSTCIAKNKDCHFH